MKKQLLNILGELGLLVLSSLIFSLAFPSFLNDWGFAFLAWFSLIPVFVVVHRAGWLKTVLYGLFYGFVTYRIFNFWLEIFNPVAYIVVPLIYAGFFGVFFALFKWADSKLPRHGWLVQSLFWLLYEVVRTKGFVGYSYGIIGYTQYRFLSLIGISDITGVLGVSALVVIPSAFIAWLINYVPRKELFSLDVLKNRKVFIPVVVYGAVFLAVNFYGWAARVDYSESPRWRTTLVQHNEDAWRSNLEQYKKSYENLSRLSAEAIAADDPDIVIWPETAFVPAIEWHEKYRQEAAKLVLVRKLRAFLKESDTAFLIGNNDSIMEGGEKKSWNAALLFEEGEIVDRYRKLHLVPFGEYFPYEKLMPRFHQYILDQGAAMYEHGEEWTVMDQGGVKFSNTICYEDVFPYLARGFVKEGAEVIVNITNDAWSPDAAACMQHGTMAVFRSVENRRSLVRATCSGFTSVISPNGEILAYLEPFTEDYLTYDTPVYTDRLTIFTRWGEWFDLLVVLGSLAVIALFVGDVVKKRSNKND
ncbi:MAG: apolipoprotein N-acyltransferase [Spirochaetales bacterium]|nr:apolipoprotein N-acyltransferase [Spirochaetales bacterium]